MPAALLPWCLLAGLVVLALLGIAISMLILRRQRDVARFEPMFERLVTEMQMESRTRDAVRDMRGVIRDHYRHEDAS